MNDDRYPPERYEHDLKLMLDPDHWPRINFCLKRWNNQGMEFGTLSYRDGIYSFQPETSAPVRPWNYALTGGVEVPEYLVKNGWVAD